MGLTAKREKKQKSSLMSKTANARKVWRLGINYLNLQVYRKWTFIMNLLKSLTTTAAMLLCVLTWAQEMTVRGIVKDAAGEPLVGATVIVAGTQTGTSTGLDGEFSITCPPTALSKYL